MENIIFTNDGSHTIFSKVINENYHSKHGAISESKHIFIKNGIEKITAFISKSVFLIKQKSAKGIIKIDENVKPILYIAMHCLKL